MNIKLLLPIVLLALAACQSHKSSLHTVDVYRSDNSRQCQGAGIAPEEMQRELGDIRVYSARKDYLRGVMFPAICGGETGSVNVYTIDADKVQAALARGFDVFKVNR